MSKRILFIAYFYPPLGGPGVQRPIKTIKYLKKNGYTVDVLTVSDIQFHSYDYELLKESEADNIYRTKSLDPMSILKKVKSKKNDKEKIYFKTPERLKKVIRGLFPIDDKIGWIPFSYRKALSLIKEKKYDCMIATIGPLSSGILAYQIHKKTKLPYYIDYRDHMTTHVYPLHIFKLLHQHAEYYEKKMQQYAKGIFVVGDFMKDRMIKHFGDHLNDKIRVVFNGFDEDDFSEPCPKEATAHVYIRFVGNIYGHQNLKYFVKAISQMKAHNELPDNIIFEFIGNYYLETYNLLKTKELESHINVVSQQTHKIAVRLTRSADLLLIFLATKDQDDIIPGKLFECIRSKNPILAMVPVKGEVAEILRRLGHTNICEMEDVAKIKLLLKDFFTEHKKTQYEVDSSFSRENQTKIMIDTIEADLS